MDQHVKRKLYNIDMIVQCLIDEMIEIRQSLPMDQKYLYSYVSKKIDAAGKSIGLALDKIEESENAKAKIETE